MLGVLGGDVRHALRRMRRAPGFTAVAVLSLALGIGANAAIFSLVKGVLLTRSAMERPEELVHLYLSSPGFRYATFSHPEYRDLERATAQVLSGIAGARYTFTQRDVAGGVETVPAEMVTGQYFEVRGVRPVVGRLLGREDDVAPGAHPVVVLSHAFWQSAYGGDTGVVGRSLRLNGHDYTIVGVAPPTYYGQIHGITPAVYMPMQMVDRVEAAATSQLDSRSSRSIFVTARFAPGAGMPALEAALARYRAEQRATYPNEWLEEQAVLPVPLLDVIINPAADGIIVTASGLLSMLVGLVLLVACANLASFLLAQGRARRREFSIRLALGASRRQVIRQLLTETTLLSVAGGIAGALLSAVLLRALMNAELPIPFPITVDLEPDAVVLAFTLGISLAAGVLFGLTPALDSTRVDLATTLKDEAVGGRHRGIGIRGLLVSGQVAASIVLLVMAGLFVRSMAARAEIRPGFGDAPAAVVTIEISPERYPGEEAGAFVRRALDEVRRLPGVTSAGVISNLHLNILNTTWTNIHVDGHEPPPGQPAFLIDNATADRGFFEAAGVRLREGRLFDEALDTREAAPVAIVNEAFAERFWPGESAVGRRIRTDTDELTIVGVAETARIRTLGEAPRPFLYRAYGQRSSAYVTVVARTRGDAAVLAQDVFMTLRRLDPDLLIAETKTMEQHIGTHLIAHRLGAFVIGAMALLAMTLAVIGLYGIVSHTVATRTREMGIRMSLGADRREVVRLMMGGGLRLVAIGAVVGLLAAAAGASVLRALLHGVEPFDPATFITVPLLLGLASVIAAWLPARRASRIDPVRTLRTD